MYDPNLMIAPDVGGMIQQGIQQGQQQRQQNMAKAAMAALVRDPNNQKALEALASVDPQSAQQFQQQKLEMAKQQLGAHYDNVLKGGEIVRQVQPKDQASWDQALAMAQQAGIDISEVPRVWDENTARYAQQLSGLADAFKPQPNGQIVPYTPGGGVARMNPQTHQLETLIVPNEGGHQAGTPAANVPRVHDQASYDAVPPGSQYMTPDGHIRVKQGGQTLPASGGFR